MIPFTPYYFFINQYPYTPKTNHIMLFKINPSISIILFIINYPMDHIKPNLLAINI